MNHPNLDAMRRLAGLPVLNESADPLTRKYEGMDKNGLETSRKYLKSVLESTHKDSVKHKGAQVELDVIDRVSKSIEDANKKLTEAKESKSEEKKKDDEDAKKDDKKEEKKAKHERDEDDKDAEKDDRKEEDKKKREKKLDDKDAKKDDKKEAKKDKELKESIESIVDRILREAGLVNENDSTSKLTQLDVLGKLELPKGKFLDKVPFQGKEDSSKLTPFKVLSAITNPDGKGLEKHNETGFKPLGIPSEDNPKGEFGDSDMDQDKEFKKVSLRGQ